MGAHTVTNYHSASKISQTTVAIDSADAWQKITRTLTAPQSCYKLKIEFSTEYGNALYLDDVELRMV